jgi:hypothetical protein
VRKKPDDQEALNESKKQTAIAIVGVIVALVFGCCGVITSIFQLKPIFSRQIPTITPKFIATIKPGDPTISQDTFQLTFVNHSNSLLRIIEGDKASDLKPQSLITIPVQRGLHSFSVKVDLGINGWQYAMEGGLIIDVSKDTAIDCYYDPSLNYGEKIRGCFYTPKQDK